MRDKFLFQVLQRDIKAHGRIVSSVVKLGDKVFTQQQEQKQQRKQQHQFSQPLQIVRSLERRWHQLFLLSLEWQYHIETLVSRIRNKASHLLYFLSFIKRCIYL